MRKYLLLPLLVVILYSCGKDKPTAPQYQYSTWTVNNTETFSSNNMNVSTGNLMAGFQCRDEHNWFDLAFYAFDLPFYGNWPFGDSLLASQQNPNYIYLSFYYKDVFYIHSPSTNSRVTASPVNEKASYRLPPTWFINYYNHNDSILIEGVFHEP